MAFASMIGRATIRVALRHLNDMIVDVITMLVVQLTVLQIIDMVSVTNSGVPALRTMLVMGYCHGGLPTLAPSTTTNILHTFGQRYTRLRLVGAATSDRFVAARDM
jgi:hypothetical protein